MMADDSWQFDVAMHHRTIFGIIFDPVTKAQVVRMVRAPGEATRLLAAAIAEIGAPRAGFRFDHAPVVYAEELRHACLARGVRVVPSTQVPPQARAALAAYLDARGAA
jgi:hypothetical protein